jgi:hypothetical protein
MLLRLLLSLMDTERGNDEALNRKKRTKMEKKKREILERKQKRQITRGKEQKDNVQWLRVVDDSIRFSLFKLCRPKGEIKKIPVPGQTIFSQCYHRTYLPKQTKKRLV